MKLDHDFVQVSKFSEDQKKRSSPKLEHFFPQIQVDTYAQMHSRVKLLGGDADIDHTKLLGGIQSNYWGDVSPPDFGTPDGNQPLTWDGATED